MALTDEEKKMQRDFVRAIGQDIDLIQEMMSDGVVEVADGCEVEPDGRCPHGFTSPLILLGYI